MNPKDLWFDRITPEMSTARVYLTKLHGRQIIKIALKSDPDDLPEGPDRTWLTRED